MDHQGGALWADWDQHNDWEECGQKRRLVFLEVERKVKRHQRY